MSTEQELIELSIRSYDDDINEVISNINEVISNHLSTKYRSETSWNNHSLDVLKSGLQKYIRRSEEKKALYCAGELDLFKHAKEHGEGIRSNFIHRLMIIYLEDVGLGGIKHWFELDGIITNLLLERKKKTRNFMLEENLITIFIHILCKSEKTRLCSHVRAITRLEFHNLTNDFPHINKIQKNCKVKLSFKENCDKFVTLLKNKKIECIYYATCIANDEEVTIKSYGRKKKPVYYLFKLLEKFSNKNIHTVALRWFEELKGVKESFLSWYTLILMYIFMKEEIVKDLPFFTDNKNKLDWLNNRKSITFVFDDYVYDIHTRKNKGKTKETFAVEGAYVDNESKYTVDEWKQFYNKTKGSIYNSSGDTLNYEKKKIIENVDKEFTEKQVFNFIVRTQLVTSARKLDVYLAKEKLTGKVVIVKGPYTKKEQIKIVLFVTEWKNNNKLEYIPVRVMFLIPDMWDKTPLGVRNSIDVTKPCWFLVFDSLLDENVEQKTHSSKLWPETQVVDFNKYKLHMSVEDLDNEKIMKNYVVCLLFRYVFGITDLADRNFIVLKNGHVCSIDEDLLGRDVSFRTELRKNKANLVQIWLEKNYHVVFDIVNKWNVDSDEYTSKYKMLLNKEKCVMLFD